jgi:hypothetical protein
MCLSGLSMTISFLIGKLILVENFSDNFEEYFKSFLKYSAKHVN